MSIKADIKTSITEQKLKSLHRLKTLLTFPNPGAKTKIFSVRFLNAAVTTVDNLAYRYFICSKSHWFFEGTYPPNHSNWKCSFKMQKSNFQTELHPLVAQCSQYQSQKHPTTSSPHLTPSGHVTGSASSHLLSSHLASTCKSGITRFFGHREKCLETWALPCRVRGTVLESVKGFVNMVWPSKSQTTRGPQTSLFELSAFSIHKKPEPPCFCLLLWIYAKQ